MALSWSNRRQGLYTAVAVVGVIIILLIGYQTFFTASPTCFDGTQNGGEAGVDCGGSCSLLCTNSAHAPVVLWSRAFEVASSTYTTAAYIQNNNIGAGARAVKYSFQLFDANNLLVVERDGVVDLPPVQTIPLIETGINVGTRSVTRVLFAFSNPPVWQKVTKTFPVLHISQQTLNQGGTRLSAIIANDSLQDAQNVTVVAVLFDGVGVARAASKSIFSVIAAKSSQPVAFTWPQATQGVVRAEITVLPSF